MWIDFKLTEMLLLANNLHLDFALFYSRQVWLTREEGVLDYMNKIHHLLSTKTFWRIGNLTHFMLYQSQLVTCSFYFSYKIFKFLKEIKMSST